MIARRRLLQATGLGILSQAAFRARLASAQSRPAPVPLFDIEQVHRHVWIALARPALVLNCNAVIFEQSRGLVVVDTHSKPSAAAALVAQIRAAVSTKPVAYVIQTHFHYDHAQGTAGYPRSVPVIGTTTTRELLASLGASRAASSVESMRRNAGRAREELSRAKSPQDRAYWNRVLAEAEAFVREMKNFEPVLPDITFPDLDSGLVLHDPLQDLHLLFRGRAHTASDLCVWSPQTRLIATGDLLTGFLPGMGDGFPMEWAATLRSLGQVEFERVLPGHGLVQPGKQRLTELTGYIEEAVELTAAAKRSGQLLDQAQANITPSSIRALQGTYGQYVAAMERRFRLWRPGDRAEAGIVRAVQANVAKIYESLPV